MPESTAIPLPAIVIASALFGLVFGSFANVVIWRVPRGRSIVSPPSACPACGHVIRWYDNIPVLSWVALRGRCRDCGAAIPWRYPAVEALAGTIAVVAVLAYGASLRAAVAWAFLYGLMILSFIDADTGRLPDPIVGALGVVGVAFVLLAQVGGVPAAPLIDLAPGSWVSMPAASGGLGMLLGAGTGLTVAFAYEKARHVRGLGMGDVKLLGVMGLFLGPYVLMGLFLGSLYGVAWVVAGSAGRGGSEDLLRRKFRFGPFLALGGAVAMLAGPWLWRWYAGIIGIVGTS